MRSPGRILVVLALLVAGCYFVHRRDLTAVGIGANIRVSSADGAFVGEASPTQVSATLGGIAGIVSAIGIAFF